MNTPNTVDTCQVLKYLAQTYPATSGRINIGIIESMQKPGLVIAHLIKTLGFAGHAQAFFADTGVHFSETIDRIKWYQDFFGIEVIVCKPKMGFHDQCAQFGRALHLRNDSGEKLGENPGYKYCCFLRKLVPIRNEIRLRKIPVVIDGLHRSDGGPRANLLLEERDRDLDVRRFHPLVDWTDMSIDEYVTKHDIPIHPLYHLGYQSIGCSTCTIPVPPGGDKRSGRWAHLNLPVEARYCGINAGDLKL